MYVLLPLSVPTPLNPRSSQHDLMQPNYEAPNFFFFSKLMPSFELLVSVVPPCSCLTGLAIKLLLDF